MKKHDYDDAFVDTGTKHLVHYYCELIKFCKKKIKNEKKDIKKYEERIRKLVSETDTKNYQNEIKK